MFWPTYHVDSLTSFDVLAKGIAHEGNLINSIILEKRVGFGAAYPPLYSFALAYSYMLGFKLSKIIPVLFFISFPFSFYTISKKSTNPTNAIFFTLLAILTPELLAFSAINITSVPHAIYASLGVVLLMTWYKLKENRYFYLSAILISLNCFTRSEGIIYVCAILPFLIITTFKSKEYVKTLLYIGISIFPFILWQLFLKSNIGIMEQFIQVEIIRYPNLDFRKIIEILKLAFNTIKSTKYFGVTFYLFIFLVILNGFNIFKKKDNLWLLSIIFFSFFGYLVLLNQLELKADSLERIIKFSGKRFFFGVIILMWFYISTNSLVTNIFNILENYLNYKKTKISK